MESQEGYLKPGPDCLAGCAECRQELAGERPGPRWQPMDWESVLRNMKQSRWVFDARRWKNWRNWVARLLPLGKAVSF